MPATRPRLSDNLHRIRERIDRAAKRVGRDVSEVRLIVVTKKVKVEWFDNLAEIGVTEIGENRVLDARAKKEETSSPFLWHLIGHLQRNKVSPALDTFDFFQSIDSHRLARAVSEEIRKKQLPPPPCLIQVNVSGESTKSGFSPPELPDFFAHASELSLRLDGFMTMAPYRAAEKECRSIFEELTRIRDQYTKQHPQHDLSQLSMGMSRDFELAIEEGATMVRVGSACFEGVES